MAVGEAVPFFVVDAMFGMTGGLLLGVSHEVNHPRPDIGVRFDNLQEARLGRDFGRLSKGQIDEAIGKAVANFMEKGGFRVTKTLLAIHPIPPFP